MAKGILRIEIDFPDHVIVSGAELANLDQLVGRICEAWKAEHPGQTMWPFGTGQKMLSNPYTHSDDEPLKFDELTYHIECTSRADYEWPCRKCGEPQGDHRPGRWVPGTSTCEFEPAPKKGKPTLTPIEGGKAHADQTPGGFEHGKS